MAGDGGELRGEFVGTEVGHGGGARRPRMGCVDQHVHRSETGLEIGERGVDGRGVGDVAGRRPLRAGRVVPGTTECGHA
nr:hypothetical protein [Gordonia sp. NB41Y]